MDDDDVDGTTEQSVPESAAAPAPQRPPRIGRVARQLARRRRRERIGGILVALLGVAVLIVAFVALRHPHQSASTAGTDTRASTPPQNSFAASPSGASASAGSAQQSTAHSSTRSSTQSGHSAVGTEPLVVVNQSQTADLAHRAAAQFRSAGWQVSSVQETFNNDVVTSTAYYDPSVAGAQAAAGALRRQFPGIHRVAERFAPVPDGDALPPGPVVVVLTDDYSS